MNAHNIVFAESVNVSGIGDSPDDGGRHEHPGRAQEHDAGAVLRGQTVARVIVAIAIASTQFLLTIRAVGTADALNGGSTLLAFLGAYVAAILLWTARVRMKNEACHIVTTCVLATDLAFILAFTAVTTTPAHYDRALVGIMVVVHIANYFFGGRLAWRTMQIGIGAYLALVLYTAAQFTHYPVVDELWTLLLFSAGMLLMVVQASDVRRRLRALVTLFEHAEDGDFARAYDVEADRRPDGITRVGQAYNRVRTQLSNMVLTDPLTGCLNRRGFDQALAREVARATRAGLDLGLIALDLDHFKQVNDTYGHLAGDAVLREVGALLLASGRAGDVVARVGGEEFAILLPETGTAGAHLFAARLCERMRSHHFTFGVHNTPVTLTTSVGVAVGAPRGEPNFSALLWSRADNALYAAKHASRDCVRAWNHETEHSGEHAVIQSGRGSLQLEPIQRLA